MSKSEKMTAMSRDQWIAGEVDRRLNEGFELCKTEQEVEALSADEYEIQMKMLIRMFLNDYNSGWRPNEG